LKNSIEEYEQNFSKLMTEITAIKSGSMDKVLKDEIRGVLARKYGKKLLDSWVPDEDAIKEAVEAGPPTDQELKAVDAATEAEVEGVPGPEEATAVVDEAKEPEVLVEETKAPRKEEDQEEGDVTMKEPSASPTKPTTPAPQAAEASSPADKDESAVSPASDLSSPPGSPVKSKGGRGAFKRKASAQPRGAPASKRSTKRRNTATPAVEEETPTEEPEVEKEEEEADPVELVPETPAPVEDEPPKRGRRSTKRLPLGIHHLSIRNVLYQLRRLDQILPHLPQRVDLDEDVKVEGSFRNWQGSKVLRKTVRKKTTK
jgi:bromodomain-containing protein 8